MGYVAEKRILIPESGEVRKTQQHRLQIARSAKEEGDGRLY